MLSEIRNEWQVEEACVSFFSSILMGSSLADTSEETALSCTWSICEELLHYTLI